MTGKEKEWIESEFKKKKIKKEKILGKIGLVDADGRGFQARMLNAQDNPKLSGYDFYKEYALLFFASRRRHTILQGDWSSDVCSSDRRFRHSCLPQVPSLPGREAPRKLWLPIESG